MYNKLKPLTLITKLSTLTVDFKIKNCGEKYGFYKKELA